MTLQQFVDAFRAQVTDPGRQAALFGGVAIPPGFFAGGAYNPGDCPEIDAWWNAGNLVNGLGTPTAPNAGQRDDWRTGRGNDAVIGQNLGILYNLGLERTGVNVRIVPLGPNAGGMDITIVGPTGMPAAGFANVRAALGGGGGGGAARNAYRTGMQGVAALPRNVAINNDAAGNAIADAWFALTVSGGGNIADANLIAANARALWDNNWDAADIQNNAGDIRVVHPVTGANVDGFAAINALGNKALLVPIIPQPTPVPKLNQTLVQAAIDRIQNQMNSKNPVVTDSELSNQLGVSDWKEDYLKKSEDEDNLKVRENAAIAAVNKLRERNPEEDRLNALREAAIKAVNDHWTDKAGSATGKINGKDKSEVLESGWEQGIRGKFNESSIDAERDRLKGLIDTEKAQERTYYSPYYYDEGEEPKSTDDKLEATKKSTKITDEESPTIPVTQVNEESPDEIIAEIKENIDNKYVPNNIVENIMKEPDLFIGDEQEILNNVKEVKEVLINVEECLKKEEYKESDALLLEKLKSYQGSDSVACRAVNKNGQKISEAISHLEKLKMNQESSSVRTSDKSWWAEKSTGAKIALVGLPILGVILIGVIFTKSKKKDTESEE